MPTIKLFPLIIKNIEDLGKRINASPILLQYYSYETLLKWRQTVMEVMLEKINDPNDLRREAHTVFCSELSGKAFEIVLHERHVEGKPRSGTGVYVPTDHRVFLLIENLMPESPRFRDLIAMVLDHELHHAYLTVVNAKQNKNSEMDKIGAPYDTQKNDEAEQFLKKLNAGLARVTEFEDYSARYATWSGWLGMSAAEEKKLLQWQQAIEANYVPQLEPTRDFNEQELIENDDYFEESLEEKYLIEKRFDKDGAIFLLLCGSREDKNAHFIQAVNRIFRIFLADQQERLTEIDARLHEMKVSRIFFPELHHWHDERHKNIGLTLQLVPQKTTPQRNTHTHIPNLYQWENIQTQSRIGTSPMAQELSDGQNQSMPMANWMGLMLAGGYLALTLYRCCNNQKEQRKNHKKLK